MKQIIAIALLGLAVAGFLAFGGTLDPRLSFSPEQVEESIASLRKFIIPPKGTTKADVDAVFGEPKVTEELRGKGSAAMHPMCSYQLLSPKQGQPFRAFLYVTYRNGKAHFAGINHACVTKGRTFATDAESISRENRLVLADLIEIRKKYESKLEEAPWNR